MSLRQKLLLVFSFTVVLAVAAVAGIVSLRTRQAFTKGDEQHTAALIEQFRRELRGRAEDVAIRVDELAAGDPMVRIAVDLAANGDPSPYLAEAATLARDHQLDYLEILLPDGTIVSSAQYPARFGYKQNLTIAGDQPSFLKKEELAEGTSEVGLFALRKVPGSEPPLYVLGGKRLDRGFLANLAAPADSLILLYPALTANFNASTIVSSTGDAEHATKFQPIIQQAISTGQERRSVIYLTNRREDSVDAAAIPMKSPDGTVLAVLVVANSRRALVELQQHIRAIGYGVAGVGILLTIVASLWLTSRISRPIERLAHAAGAVAAGNWDTQVEISTHDEVGELARSFNHMTQQLSEQRERLIQSERVAAWRELARRLAHELKNPLFPLQLTLENLIKARSMSGADFDEIFRESTETLSVEIANLKNIVGRFSDFSKMPKPQLEDVDMADVLRKISALYEPALSQHQPPIGFECRISDEPLRISADPELLHRALSNLVLNAMDAMPNGGTLAIAAGHHDESVELRISDTGTGMTAEECERLFTPYYTTKQHGTGLGLAIVQSVISDHNGTIRVESTPGTGTTFVVELPSLTAGAAKA